MQRLLTCLSIFITIHLSAGCLHHSPGTLHQTSLEDLSRPQLALRDAMQRDVAALANDVGPRNAGESYKKVLEAEALIVDRLGTHGLESRRDEVSLGGVTVANVEVTFPGTERPDEIIVVGGHYDTVAGSPGANDNGSGVAMLLATARALRDVPLKCTVRIVFFVNEENPFSGGVQMGSRVYAEGCRARDDNIIAMINVDSVGYFSSEPGSQRYPAFIFGLPSRGNFVAFASNRDNIPLLDHVVATFQKHSRFPSIGVASDSKDMSRSDHAPFWWQGYPAISLSDTSQYRDPNYHSPTDVATNLNYNEMARLAEGLIATVQAIANDDRPFP